MLQNRPYNELVDVWAAGILLYIMCAKLAARWLTLRHFVGTNLLLFLQAEWHVAVLRGQPR